MHFHLAAAGRCNEKQVRQVYTAASFPQTKPNQASCPHSQKKKKTLKEKSKHANIRSHLATILICGLKSYMPYLWTSRDDNHLLFMSLCFCLARLCSVTLVMLSSHVCLYCCVSVLARACIYIHMYPYTFVHLYIHTHIYIQFINTHTHTCTCVCVGANIDSLIGAWSPLQDHSIL